MKKLVFWLIALAVLLAACGTAALQLTATNEPKSPPVTPSASLPMPDKTQDSSTVSGDTPVSNETPPAMDATPSPLDPLPDEENMIRGEAFVDSAEILMLESYPEQVNLHVKGNLPTPCHLLRANVSEPDENGRINVELYSLSEPGVICIQVLQSFDTTIPLGTYPSGSYTVYLNGDKVGEFTV